MNTNPLTYLTHPAAPSWIGRLSLAAALLFLPLFPASPHAAAIKPADLVGLYSGDAASGVSALAYDAELEVTHIQKRKVRFVLTLTHRDTDELYAIFTAEGPVNAVGIFNLKGTAQVGPDTFKTTVRGFYTVHNERERIAIAYLIKKQGDRGSIVVFGDEIEE